MPNYKLDQYNDPDRWLLAEEVAAELRISKNTLRKMWKSGDFPAPTRFNKRVHRWRRSAIEEYLRNRQEA